MMPSPPGEESKTAPPPLEIDTERTIQRRNSSLDEDTTDVLAHLEASPSPKGKSRAFPFPSPRRNRLSSDDIAPPDDDVEAIIEGAEEGRLPRLLPEGDRAALIERLRTDLFEVQRDSELSASQRRPASPLPPTPVSVPDSTDTQKLGTFKGVFLPCLQNILGVILFLRAGWVVGNVGLMGAIAIVVIANAVTFATALSVSTVATNMRVGAGGAYFIMDDALQSRLLEDEMITASSDGSPTGFHPRGHGTFAKIIEEYVVNRGAVSLEEMVRKMTSFSASILGLQDRGSIELGKVADLVLFDPETIRANATYPNPLQLSSGFDMVFIAGEVAFENGASTQESLGDVLSPNQ